MRNIRHPTKTKVQKAGGKGRGVFAVDLINKNEIIEIAAFIRLSVRDHDMIKETELISYVFDAGRGEAAVGLGTASLYNHSDNPNVDYDLDRASQTIRIASSRRIEIGEEITIDYGYHPAKPSTWAKA